MPQWIKDVAKAFSGAAFAGIAAASTALLDGHIDGFEWLAIAAAVIYGGYGVWQTPDSMSPMRRVIALKNSQQR